MGSTLAEKILARAAGRQVVKPGEIIWVEPDWLVCNDMNFPRFVRLLAQEGIDGFARPERVLVAIDHRPLPENETIAAVLSGIRRDVIRLGVGRFFDAGRGGISHIAPVDTRDVAPGMLVLASDTHTPTLGGCGALGISISHALPAALAAGKTWLRVPGTVQVVLKGQTGPGVMVRDVAQYMAAQIGPEVAEYRVLEFTGSLVAGLSVMERMTLCNLGTETEAKGAVVPADAVTARHYDGYALPPGEWTSDSDAVYDLRLEIDVTGLEPQVAVPPSPRNVQPVSAVAGTPVQQAFLGSCASGKLEDLRVAAAMLKGRRVHPGVQLLVLPASRAVLQEALNEGLLTIFTEAGAMVSGPACGPCFGALAPLAAGETCISSSTRNEPGRMGSREAAIYLASPAIVAASAITGAITDPRTLMEGGR